MKFPSRQKRKKRKSQPEAELAVLPSSAPKDPAAPPAGDGDDVEHAEGRTEGDPGSSQPAAARPDDTAPGSPQQGRKRQRTKGAATEQADDESGGQPDEGSNEPSKAHAKAAPVLPWMRLPISIESGEGTPLAEVRGLDPRLQARLRTGGIVELFPVQAAAWVHTAGGHSTAHDLCIAAPTGSGKTLAYVLPIVQGLAGRCVPRLRCLVVLPTRDLAAQVFKVFAGLCPAVGLRVGLAAAQVSVGAEATALFGHPSTADDIGCSADAGAAGCSSGVDILVATPGRLMAHLRGTPGATLQHLRYLVIDETDRLLRQAYQDWLPFVMGATSPALESLPGYSGSSGRTHAAPGSHAVYKSEQRVLKIVASATLTRDPAKLERLLLHAPRCIAVGAAGHRYPLPKALKEYKVVCAGADKPLVAAALLQQLAGQPTVVFTASVEATRRLYVLLSALPSLQGRLAELSSLNSTAQRAAALAAFRVPDGQVTVLVASDAMTRGMDVEGIANVVNYDAPVYAKTYVHRAGRTARAGRTGRVLSVLRLEEVRHFKGLLRKLDGAYVRDWALDRAALEALRPACQHALGVLQAYLEAQGGDGG